MHYFPIFAAILALANTGIAICIQYRTLYNGYLGVGDDGMSIHVWVNGDLVCSGGDGQYLAAGDTDFCLQNGDGQGTNGEGSGIGCLEGYSFCTTLDGNPRFYYWGMYNLS